VAGYKDPLLQRLHRALFDDFELEAEFTMRVGVRRALEQSVEEIASDMDVTVADVRSAMRRLEKAAETMAA
jgi:DNA-directed RNA polymerase specialized sigma24 family protein